MVRPDRLPSTPTLLLGMMLLMIFTAWCATPPGPIERAMTLQQHRANRDFEVSAAAIHCTHDALPGAEMEMKQVGARSGGPLPGPILPRRLMHTEGEGEGATQITRQHPRDSELAGPAPQPRTPSVGSSLLPCRSR